MPTWNAPQYLQFAAERTRPCHDLIARIALPAPRNIVDLGCGPGNSAEALATRWPAAKITGLDNSPAMIAAAQKSHPQHTWLTAGIATWSPAAAPDLLFSNAALQWVPDHATLLPRLAKQIAPGGAFAMQVPANMDEDAHRLMRQLAASPAWRSHFPHPVREWFVHTPAFYYDTLAPIAKRIDLWTAEYYHVLPDVHAIVEWYKGTGLRPFLDLLSPPDQSLFLTDYEHLLKDAYPTRIDGRVIFPFLRLFLIAYIE